jgi:hypothetical protein
MKAKPHQIECSEDERLELHRTFYREETGPIPAVCSRHVY